MSGSGSADQRRGDARGAVGRLTRGDRVALGAIAAAWLLSLLMWAHPGLTIPDGAGYYVYLPSTWIDRDLLFFNEWQRLGLIRDGIPVFKSATATDHLGNHWTVGPALLWYPAFTAADGAVRTLPQFQSFARDGFVVPYNVAVVATSAVAGLLTLLTGFVIARRWFTPFASCAGALAVWFGTPLLWYSVRDAAMSHAVSSFACALVVLLSLRQRGAVTRETAFSVGLALGFAAMVRIQNAAFLLVPFAVLAGEGRKAFLRQSLPFIGGGILGVLPELVVSTILYGQPLGFASIGVRAIGWHPWSHFWITETLFSWYHGLFAWTPVAAIGVVGLFALIRHDRSLGLAALAMFVVQWITNASADRAFWAAISFGSRRFDNCAIFFLLGVAALAHRWPRVTAAAAAIASIWTMLLFFAAKSLDLNAYQTFSELVAAIQATAGDGVAGLLVHVPPGRRAIVLSVLISCLVLNALLIMAALALRPRMRAAVAAAYFAAMTALMASAGANGASRVERYRPIIERSRAFAALAGYEIGEQNLFETELNYLRKAGRTEEAEATRRELETMLRRRAAALAAAGAR